MLWDEKLQNTMECMLQRSREVWKKMLRNEINAILRVFETRMSKLHLALAFDMHAYVKYEYILIILLLL